ncbi:YidC/Oxa1 family membrane protein insertase [Anaerosinus gibii]|uniref:YidC/Oxa1 family membrane protein insertase n=1 Tax=Selenobaculum gibii TaxID=3054208 RepID=A0A9Y2AIR6_9FIRM|nr:YidC/Oxa1 family membrane protein insertase [Selenobaculum gbiensis]WIW70748.1 YidC/Oxa1 family membrane protein insertase [Selenobaculum gbiensis]
MGDIFDLLIGFLQSFLTVFYQLSSSIGIPNYGVAIILMTIVIKVLLYPLTVKQVKSMKAMQDLQPKMKKIQDKYGKKDPQRMQQEMAALYKDAGVNPLAGCLPLLAQMPLLIGIFYAIRDYTYLGTPSFLWIHNLSEADPLYILPIISAVTIYIQQKQTMTTNSDMNQQAKIMLYMMPLFIGYISLSFPAGLVLYWAMSNVMQIVQQWWMYRSDEGKKKEA